MKINLNTYAINRAPIQEWYRKNSEENIRKTVSVWAANTHCPCIALAFYLAEDVGYVPELCKTIDGLIKFYGYTEVNGQSANSPYLTLDKKSCIVEE